MSNPTATISMSEQDAQLIKERRLSPSKVFRRALYMIRAEQLNIDTSILIDPLDEIFKLRNALKAQNETIKEQAKMLRDLVPK